MNDKHTRRDCNLANLLGVFDNTISILEIEANRLQHRFEQIRRTIEKLQEYHDASGGQDMKRPTLTGKVRSDSEGDGRFGSRRGTRLHNGTDYEVIPNDPVLSPMMGVLVRQGVVYENRTDFTLCEIVEGDLAIKLMYMTPFPSYIGRRVKPGEIIGFAQDISKKQASYAGVGPHVHAELRIRGQLVDPEKFMNGG